MTDVLEKLKEIADEHEDILAGNFHHNESVIPLSVVRELIGNTRQDTSSKEVVSVKMQHPESKEEKSVTFDIKYLKDIIETDLDRVYDALGEQFCNCQPVGETNVVECGCIDYLECFDIMSTDINTLPTTESKQTKSEIDHDTVIIRDAATGEIDQVKRNGKWINLAKVESTEWIAVSEPSPIYQQAIDAWGIQSQVSMAQGECGELIAALTQFFVQGKIDRVKVIDEIADVEIMCSQLRCLFSYDEVDKCKAEKLERLQGILDGSISHPHTPPEAK